MPDVQIMLGTGSSGLFQKEWPEASRVHRKEYQKHVHIL